MRRLNGSIQQRGPGRWRVFATVHDDDGNARRVSKCVSGTRGDAERVLDSMLDMDGKRPDTRFCEVLGAYIAHIDARVADGSMAESTRDGYVGKIRRSIEPGLGRLMVSDLTARRVQRFVDGLEHDRPGTWRVLRAVLNWAHRQGYTSEKVADRVEPVAQVTGKVTRDMVYTAAEAAAILNHPMPEGLKTAVVLALSCGLRRGEICALTWDDYDGATVDIRKAWGKDKPKTEASIATLAVPQWARDYLDGIAGDGPMVGLSPDRLTHLWVQLWKRGEPPVRHIPFKNLRHTSLSMVYEQTRDIKATSRRGRHSSVYITERFYVRPSESVDEGCAAALDDAMGDGFEVSR